MRFLSRWSKVWFKVLGPHNDQDSKIDAARNWMTLIQFQFIFTIMGRANREIFIYSREKKHVVNERIWALGANHCQR